MNTERRHARKRGRGPILGGPPEGTKRGARPRVRHRVLARRIAARTRNGLVLVDLEDVWGFEAAGRLAFVHSRLGKFDVDLSLARLAESLGEPFHRVHRNWVVNLRLVRSIERADSRVHLFVGSGLGLEGIAVPVSRGLVTGTRALLLRDALGIRAAPSNGRWTAAPHLAVAPVAAASTNGGAMTSMAPRAWRDCRA